MNIIFENGINEFNGHELAAWSNEKGIDFQEQWMGPTIEYPLNYSKLKSLENLYSIFADKEFINYCFKNAVIKSISLTVFGYNKSAKALYEKLGFKIVETINKPDLKYIMKKYR